MLEAELETVLEDAVGSVAPTRVLLVEDDPRAATLIREMLRTTWSEGLVFTHAELLADATQELLDHGATCVLLDLSLRDAGPVESVEYVRIASPDVPIVVLSSHSDEETALLAVKAGAQDFLVKSELHPALLRRAVKYAIERKRSEVQLAHQALHDPLTGLPNRALFLDRLGVALDRSRRTSTSVAVLFLDVDNFKEINDTHGHAAGDMLLTGLANRLRTTLRPMDTVARFGGDEFTFLFEDLASEREVVLIAERISRDAQLPIVVDDGESAITVSIGIAMVADPSIPPETVIREADAAMYRAKELGRSRYELFDESSRQRAMDRLELETALRHAVERGELRIHYQPIFALDGGLSGFEALVRWQHPERGLLGPAEFIPLAEETGLVIPIGGYVLEHALAQLARWRAVKPEITISVNLSFRQLEDTGLVSMVAGALAGSGIDPGALCLEIDEASVTHNPEVADRVLKGLAALGVRVALDDYGSGSSSLSSLTRLPIDRLKIHHSFVSGLGADPGQAPILGAVIDLAHALGLAAVAKGVETDAQLAQLRALGCDAAQGYLLGAPVPEADTQAFLLPR